MTPAPHFVFGYGSLLERWQRRDADQRRGAGPWPAELAGYRRTWNVAMDNRQTIPGYKYYVDAATGERGDWLVTFLNVIADRDSRVNGLLFAVTAEQLAALDRRERNYDRVEVTGRVTPDVDGRTWVYAGSAAAMGRFEAGYRTGRAAIPRAYRQRVLNDFAELGADTLSAFSQLTDPPRCPVLDLRRVDLPHAPRLTQPRSRHGAHPEPTGGRHQEASAHRP